MENHKVITTLAATTLPATLKIVYDAASAYMKVQEVKAECAL